MNTPTTTPEPTADPAPDPAPDPARDPTPSPLGSIIIAAHNEQAVIGRTLSHLAALARDGRVQVVVVCNGCTDETAAVASGYAGVQVRELTEASKVGALREGDRVTGPGPRIYLDADVELTQAAAVATLQALAAGTLAGRPPCRFDTSGAPWLVRRWYAARASLPSVTERLWGAGCYGLSVAGRARFTEFPEVLGDDLFVDSLFDSGEVRIVDTDPVIVRTPRTVGDLIRTKRRSYRTQRAEAGGGSGAIADSGAVAVSGARGSSHRWAGASPGQRSQAADLAAILRDDPRRVADVLVYAGVMVVARAQARFGPTTGWERDTSSR